MKNVCPKCPFLLLHAKPTVWIIYSILHVETDFAETKNVFSMHSYELLCRKNIYILQKIMSEGSDSKQTWLNEN